MVQEILRIRAVTTGWIGAPGLSQFYFAPTTGTVLTPTDATDAAAAIHTFYNAVKNSYPATWAMTITSAVQVLEATTGALLREVAVTPPGTVAGTGNPNFRSTASGPVMSWHTSGVFGGRLLRGRTFMVPTDQVSFNSQGQIDGTVAAYFQAAGAALLATTTPIFVIWHRPGPSGVGGGSGEVTACTVSATEGILRSRRD